MGKQGRHCHYKWSLFRGAQGEGGTGRGSGGIDPKIAARNNPCDYAVIAVGLAEMMEEQENLETRRVIRHRSEVGVCVISNYAVITERRGRCSLCWSVKVVLWETYQCYVFKSRH